MKLPRPILVFGMNRTGTKWLCNMLAQHPAVCCVQRERFGGILETNMFHHYQQKFRLSYDDDFVAFLHLWRNTDFVECTEIDVMELSAQEPNVRDPIKLFAQLMNAYALRKQADYWLQKSGPESAREVAAAFPDAKLIIIERDMHDTIASTMQLTKNQGGHASLASTVHGFVLQQKVLRQIAKSHTCCSVRYEELRASPEPTMRRLCEEIELEYVPDVLHSPYDRNTSFRNTSKPPTSRLGDAWIACLATGLKIVPFPIADGYSRMRRCFSPPPPFVPGTFAGLKSHLRLESKVSSK